MLAFFDSMSDAITDLGRDQERNELLGAYRKALDEFILHRTSANRQAVVEAARAVDEIRRGFCTGRTNLSNAIEERLDRLAEHASVHGQLVRVIAISKQSIQVMLPGWNPQLSFSVSKSVLPSPVLAALPKTEGPTLFHIVAMANIGAEHFNELALHDFRPAPPVAESKIK